MAPEIILRCGHGSASDWWSLGILLCGHAAAARRAAVCGAARANTVCRYELLVGETPFGRGSPKATMALIAETTKDPYFPSYLSTYAIDIIKRLLTRDQAARLVRQPQLFTPCCLLRSSTLNRRNSVCCTVQQTAASHEQIVTNAHRATATTAPPPSRFTLFSG
jgi:serine/threonine protein kinase